MEPRPGAIWRRPTLPKRPGAASRPPWREAAARREFARLVDALAALLEEAARGKSFAELREKNWIVARIRERRFELDMTQKDVAEQAETSHSYISRLEPGDHTPHEADDEPERDVGPVPEAVG